MKLTNIPLVRKILAAFERPKQGYLMKNLDYLIRRSIKRMKIVPSCPFGHGKMTFRASKLNTSPMRDDIVYKCTKCWYLAFFGVPMTPNEYKKEIQLRGGMTTLLHPSWNLPTINLREQYSEEDKKIIVESLKKLGYIG